MKQYRCPSCSSLHWVAASECPDCGNRHTSDEWQEEEVPMPPSPPNPRAVELMGDLGQSLIYRREPCPREFGKLLFSRISSEGRYAARYQFSLRWQGESLLISPCMDTTCDTLVNGEVLTRERPLQHGDTIKLRGRTSGREAMTLIAVFVG